jgi:hypothetical protein
MNEFLLLAIVVVYLAIRSGNSQQRTTQIDKGPENENPTLKPSE